MSYWDNPKYCGQNAKKLMRLKGLTVSLVRSLRRKYKVCFNMHSNGLGFSFPNPEGERVICSLSGELDQLDHVVWSFCWAVPDRFNCATPLQQQTTHKELAVKLINSGVFDKAEPKFIRKPKKKKPKPKLILKASEPLFGVKFRL